MGGIMTEELIKRLREDDTDPVMLKKAADTIEAQAAEIERLKVECQAQYHRGYYDGRTALGETE
jgi:hypothetical protein